MLSNPIHSPSPSLYPPLMAVQAQCPSNILLNRNGQEGRIIMECSLQPQPGGGGGGEEGEGGGGEEEGWFLDHHQHQRHVIFPSREVTIANTSKRGREALDVIAATNPVILQQQPQPRQLINLSLPHRNNRTPHHLVSTGFRLSTFKDRHQNQHSLLPEPMSSISYDDFAGHLKHQRDEIDQYLLLQGEQLRRILAEKRQKHCHALLGVAEVAVMRRLREKEAEVEKITRWNVELEARAAQLRAVAQEWQARARTEEAAAASLHARLQQAIISGVHDREPREEDDGGCRSQEAEDAESVYEDPDRVVLVPPDTCCRACRRMPSAVVLLPCRHLCVCTECDSAVVACPVCFAGRESSIEVYFS